MAYAIVQKELVTPGIEALTRAFCTLADLTVIDAQNAANDAYGILWRGLDAERAGALQAALGFETIETEIVRESDLPSLSTPRVVRQVQLTPDHLIAFDSMQRPTPIPWGEILLLAAGQVHTRETHRRNPLESPDSVHASRTHDEEHERLVIDLFLMDRSTRFTVDADEFNFGHPPERSTDDLKENFVPFLQGLGERLPHASMNQGAFLACQKPSTLFRYPSRQAYHEEIIWLLWRIGRLVAARA